MRIRYIRERALTNIESFISSSSVWKNILRVRSQLENVWNVTEIIGCLGRVREFNAPLQHL